MSAAVATRGAGSSEPGLLDCGPLKPAGSAEAGSTTSDREAVPGISPRTLQRALPAAPLAPLLDAILKDDVAALDAYLRQDKLAVDAIVRVHCLLHRHVPIFDARLTSPPCVYRCADNPFCSSPSPAAIAWPASCCWRTGLTRACGLWYVQLGAGTAPRRAPAAELPALCLHSAWFPFLPPRPPVCPVDSPACCGRKRRHGGADHASQQRQRQRQRRGRGTCRMCARGHPGGYSRLAAGLFGRTAGRHSMWLRTQGSRAAAPSWYGTVPECTVKRRCVRGVGRLLAPLMLRHTPPDRACSIVTHSMASRPRTSHDCGATTRHIGSCGPWDGSWRRGCAKRLPSAITQRWRRC